MSPSLDRLARGCVLPGFAGQIVPVWLAHELEEGLGGVVLFARNVRDPEQVRRLTDAIRVSPATVVAIDEEGGDVTRLEASRGSSLPSPLALGEVDDVALTEAVAHAAAALLHEAGVTHDLAPVADVNTNEANPVIGVRSFGGDARRVARHVAAFVTGLQKSGIAACVKHFPGHGATDVDSHLGLPVLDASADDIRALELEPFRAAFRAGARAVMTAHMVVSAFDAQPATVSRAVLTGLLREELGFEGMVVTDALEMGAISGTLGMGEAAVLALAAGADALCLGHDIDESHVDEVRTAIVAAVRGGRLAEERVAEAATRVAGSHAPGDSGAARKGIGLVAARRALRVDGPPPASGRAALVVVELQGTMSIAAGPMTHDLTAILRELGADAVRVDVTERAAPEAVTKAAAYADRRTVVVMRDVVRHPWQRGVARALAAARPDTLVVDVGYPDAALANGLTRLTTFGAGRASLTAAAELILGRT